MAGLSADAARPYCDRAAAETGVRYELREEGDSLHILCRGKGAHASLPEEGVNAITGLLHLLCSLPLAKVGSTAALRALSALFPHGDCAGKALGIAQSDELSGALTLAFSLLTVTGTGLEGQFDSRVPICANDENCRTAAEASFSKFGFSVSGEMDAPHHTPADSPLVKALLKCYEQYTDYKGSAWPSAEAPTSTIFPAAWLSAAVCPALTATCTAPTSTPALPTSSPPPRSLPRPSSTCAAESAFSPLEQSPWALLRQFRRRPFPIRSAPRRVLYKIKRTGTQKEKRKRGTPMRKIWKRVTADRSVPHLRPIPFRLRRRSQRRRCHHVCSGYSGRELQRRL
ncbi:MAG: peptidase dimerization domain-containing protein [Flavonifractor plautii]